MRNILRQLLGICEHKEWQTVGNVMMSLEGDEMLIEKCTKCSFTVAYRL